MKQAYITIQAAAAALIAWLSARLGILLPVLCILAVAHNNKVIFIDKI